MEQKLKNLSISKYSLDKDKDGKVIKKDWQQGASEMTSVAVAKYVGSLLVGEMAVVGLMYKNGNMYEIYGPKEEAMFHAVEKIKMKENVQYYTRSDSQMPNWKIIVNQIVSGGNSVVLACWVAVEKYPKQPVYILGCDWGINDNSSFDYIYKTGPKTKYTTHSKKKIENLFKNWEVYVVHDGNPDVSLPVIKKDSFLQLIQ